MRPFAVTITAEPSSPRAVRAQLGQWLSGAHWPDEERDAIVYAVSEAVSNAVEHAYPPGAPGEITIIAELETPGPAPRSGGESRQVRVTVTDQGTWRIPPTTSEGRRRGLSVIEALMHSVTIYHHELPAPDDDTSAARNGAATRNGAGNWTGMAGWSAGDAGRIGTTVVLISTPTPL